MRFYSEVIFPKFYDLFVRHQIFDQRRKDVLEKVEGKILEIGVGTGINLDHYPQAVEELTAVEPNPGMKKQFELKALDHRIAVNFNLCGAEKMPFASDYFDTVVSTITLCSIPSLNQALLEIRRVLKPSGKFLFLDHGISKNTPVMRIQNFLNPIWKHFGAGCQLNLDYEKELTEAGFHIKSLKTYYLPNAPKFIASVYEGMATK